jgi:hypothetical protein
MAGSPPAASRATASFSRRAWTSLVDPARSTTITLLFLFRGDTALSSDLEELIRQIMAKQD